MESNNIGSGNSLIDRIFIDEDEDGNQDSFDEALLIDDDEDQEQFEWDEDIERGVPDWTKLSFDEYINFEIRKEENEIGFFISCMNRLIIFISCFQKMFFL